MTKKTVKANTKSSSLSFKDFEKIYATSVSKEEWNRIDKSLLTNFLSWQYKTLSTRKNNEPIVQVLNATKKFVGFDYPRTLISIIVDDTAFIVDSIIALLSERGFLIENSLHPLIPAQNKSGAAPIALCFIELSRRLTAGQIESLQNDLMATLQDVAAGTRDWLMIKKAVATAQKSVETAPKLNNDDRAEYHEFITYVHDDNFTLLGSLEFNLSSTKKLDVKTGSGLGLLTQKRYKDFLTPNDLSFINAQTLQKTPEPVTISKLSISSKVHRRVPLDLILIQQYDEKGRHKSVFVLIGLFTSVTYSRSLRGIPLLRHKSKKLIAKAGFEDNSHDSRALRHIVEKYPRDELFQMPLADLYTACLDIMKLQERPRIALFLRPDSASRFLSALIYIPRDRFDTRLRMKFQTILETELNANFINFSATIDDSHLVRLLFLFKPQKHLPALSTATIKSIEEKLQHAGRSWADQLGRALTDTYKDQDKSAQMVELYAAAFPLSYQESYPVADTVYDIQKIETALQSQKIAINLIYKPETLSLKIYLPNAPLSLSEILPILENMGLTVLAEYPYPITMLDKKIIWLQDIRVKPSTPLSIENFESLKQNFENGLALIIENEIENDKLNALILSCDLTARSVAILRTYVRYARQSKMPYSLPYIEQAVTDHPAIAKMLITLFETIFDPTKKDRSAVKSIRQNILNALQAVKSIDQDRIVRAIFGTINATLRTNFYQQKNHISIKLDPSLTPELPDPKPYREMFVYAPHVEGVHLRGDKIARGGLRWSDRPEDFRIEVLGLMKAQQVKNSVIVPMGAKGGFVVKNPPKTGGREAYQAEGIRCYQSFISGLLDITDNQNGNKILPPQHVVRLDGDDPYLVVAADKGTATFSDIANALSLDYKFWLGDAFASGGSAGYDHKKMGITAKGSWESVKRHFREMDIDTQSQTFEVIGVGDMGGDVFGNGMLQSEYIQLVAAFNHLHIFVDPAPHAKTSFKERLRLFNAVKGWDQYNESLLSKGGRIFNRSDKVLKLTPEIRNRFKIEQTEISPNELIQILLKAKTDLLYFGGIGTYIKASTENHQDVGDRSNDNLRVNANEINARVIGEGANMAITQRARIECAKRGVKLNTDFIDNSAGVDTSDHEVNIKILLSNTSLKNAERNKLLSVMTDDVASLVLRDNYQQTQALSLMELQAHETLLNDSAFMNSLARDGLLNKAIEFLPNPDEINTRFEQGKGLTRPELSLILSYAKIVFTRDLLATNLPDHPDMQDWAINYFPQNLQVKYKKEILNHRLYREIVATMISNAIINRMGPTFVRLTMDATGCAADDVTKAFMTVRDAFTLRPLWDQVEALDNKVPAITQLKALRKISRLAQRETTWFLTKLGRKVKRIEDGKIYGHGVEQIRKHAQKLVPPLIWESILEQQKIWMNEGLPKSMAHEIALFKILGSVPDIVHITQLQKSDLTQTAEIYFELGALFNFDFLRSEAKKLQGDNEWSRAAIAGVLDSLYAAQANLTINVLKQSKAGKQKTGKDHVSSWIKSHQKTIETVIHSIDHIKAEGHADLAMLSVTEQRLRGLLNF